MTRRRTMSAAVFALSMACAALPVASMAQPPAAEASAVLPATPAGDYVRRWIEAFNSNDPDRMAAIDPRAVPIQRETGGFDIIRVEDGGADRVVAVAKDRAFFGTYRRVTWIFAPGTTTLTGLTSQPAPGAPVPVRMDDAALAAYVREAVQKTGYSGAVLMTRQGRTVVAEAGGLSDSEAKVPNTIDSRFRVGSMNKMFTATAILQLVQAGKVRLDAPIGTYLKDYPNREIAETVTVHNLLTHTGGVGDIFGPQFNARRLEIKTLSDYVGLYGTRPRQFAAGTNYAYANYGFVLLGRIIEEVSGQTYPAYLEQHVFKPAGMTRTGFEPESTAVEGRVKAYTTNARGALQSAADTLPWSGSSAGGGYSTVRDFAAFAQALTSHKLLDAAHYRMLTTRKANGSYAYGFADTSQDGLRMVGHSGGAPGQNGNLIIIGDGQAVIVALSNVSPPGAASQISGEILRRATLRKPDGTIATATSPGPAQPTEAEKAAAFRANDPDGDGRIDRAGYKRVLDALGYQEQFDYWFAQRDKDRDGFITQAEYTPAVALKPPAGAARPEPQRLALFGEYDKDGDQRLDRQAYKALLEEMGLGDQLDARFAQRDANSDGFITAEEYRAPAPQ